MEEQIIELNRKLCKVLRVKDTKGLTHFWYYQIGLPLGECFPKTSIRMFIRETRSDTLIDLLKEIAKDATDEDVENAIRILEEAVLPASGVIRTGWQPGKKQKKHDKKAGKRASLPSSKPIRIDEKYVKWVEKYGATIGEFVAVVRRYDLLFEISKVTMQLSVSDAYYLLMENGFKMKVEYFASPINRHLEHFCSAFPDVDYRFGSLGTFFDYAATVEGPLPSGTCDCPYQLHLIENCVDEVLGRLDGSVPVTYTFILPDWTDTNYIPKLRGSPWNRLDLVIPQEDLNFYLHSARKSGLDEIKPCGTFACIITTDLISEELVSVWKHILHNFKDM